MIKTSSTEKEHNYNIVTNVSKFNPIVKQPAGRR
jgi:hypothetical protein